MGIPVYLCVHETHVRPAPGILPVAFDIIRQVFLAFRKSEYVVDDKIVCSGPGVLAYAYLANSSLRSSKRKQAGEFSHLRRREISFYRLSAGLTTSLLFVEAFPAHGPRGRLQNHYPPWAWVVYHRAGLPPRPPLPPLPPLHTAGIAGMRRG